MDLCIHLGKGLVLEGIMDGNNSHRGDRSGQVRTGRVGSTLNNGILEAGPVVIL